MHNFPSGNKYWGEWSKAKIHGRGVKIFNDGDIYEGYFMNGLFHDKGRYIRDDNGEVYEGQWKNDNRHGQGVNKYADGDVYDGEWNDGKKHG